MKRPSGAEPARGSLANKKEKFTMTSRRQRPSSFNHAEAHMSESVPRPNLQVAARVEELLREQLEERGINPRALAPEDIAAHMHCHLAPDGSMTYLWKGDPILYVTPEKKLRNGETSVLWRMFTRDDEPERSERNPQPGS